MPVGPTGLNLERPVRAGLLPIFVSTESPAVVRRRSPNPLPGPVIPLYGLMRRGDACVARHGWPARPIPKGDACVAPYCVHPGGPDCPCRDESPDFGRSPAAGTPSGGYPNPAWMFERPGPWGRTALTPRGSPLRASGFPAFGWRGASTARTGACSSWRGAGGAHLYRTECGCLGACIPPDDAREHPDRPTYPTESGCLGESVRRWSWSGVMHFRDDYITFT